MVASADQVSTDLGDEAVILHFQVGVYYGLDEVGRRVWSLLPNSPRVSEICDVIVAEYEVDPEQCETDVKALLGELLEAGLVEVADDSAA